MEKSVFRSHLAVAAVLGSVWRSSEVMLGAGIKACAHTVSGSLMTGVALFFIAAACVYPGTAVPLSIFFAPLAILFSAFTVPVGFVAGDRIGDISSLGTTKSVFWLTGNIASRLTLVLCLALVFLFRLMVH
jgi:hypothetical protein